MMAIVQPVKAEISTKLKESIQEHFSIESKFNIVIQFNEKKGYGDLTTTIAFQLKSLVDKPPMEIAKKLVESLEISPSYVEKTSFANPGFINFYLSDQWKEEALKALAQGIDSGEKDHDFRLQKFGPIAEDMYQEIAYIIFRIQWILDGFEAEGVNIDDYNIKLEQIRWEVEEKIIDQLILIVEAMEEKQVDQEGLEVKIEHLCQYFFQYEDQLVLRQLKGGRRSFVLNLLKCMMNILKLV